MKKCIFSVLFVAAIGVSGRASADDWMTFPGNQCHATSTTVSYGGSAGTSSTFCNTSSSTVYAVCPVSRDVYNSSIDDSWAYVYDNSTSTNVSCTLYASNYATGSSYKVTRSTSGNASSYMKLTFGLLTTTGADVSWMTCTLPPQACVVSYGVNE